MNTMNRRIEIINILIIRRHTTANELAQELGVSIRTIQYDIQALSPQYPIYTKPGENGGLFIREDYNPHINSSTSNNNYPQYKAQPPDYAPIHGLSSLLS